MINGLDMAGVTTAIDALWENADRKHNPRRAQVRWLGGFKFEARVRDHAFVVDEPAKLAGNDEGPTSMEYLIGALGSCLATGFVLNASQRGVRIDELEVAIDGVQDNMFTFLGRSDEGHAGFRDVEAKLTVRSEADEATLREIWEHTVATSPVGNTLCRAVPLKPSLTVVPQPR